MRNFINIVESVTPEVATQAVLERLKAWFDEHGDTPYKINHGQCFEFVDDLESHYPELFQSIEIGNIFSYAGEYNDDPDGYDEDLIAQHWPNIKPVLDLNWQQMFHEVGLNWPGTHGWAFCKQTCLSYDAETPEGRQNPFDLPFFKPYYDEYLKRTKSK
jgi:hypothetical protein